MNDCIGIYKNIKIRNKSYNNGNLLSQNNVFSTSLVSSRFVNQFQYQLSSLLKKKTDLIPPSTSRSHIFSFPFVTYITQPNDFISSNYHNGPPCVVLASPGFILFCKR
jgi:hypothetical protein